MKKCCWNCRNLTLYGNQYYCQIITKKYEMRRFLLDARRLSMKEVMKKLSEKGVDCKHFRPVKTFGGKKHERV